MRDRLRVHEGGMSVDRPPRTREILIALRQLERAELYIVAVISLQLGDGRVDARAAQVLDGLRALRDTLRRLQAAG